jgi:hypothetical protein
MGGLAQAAVAADPGSATANIWGLLSQLSAIGTTIGSLMILGEWKAGFGASLISVGMLPGTYIAHFVPWTAAVAGGDSAQAAVQWEQLLIKLALLGAMCAVASESGSATSTSGNADGGKFKTQ